MRNARKIIILSFIIKFKLLILNFSCSFWRGVVSRASDGSFNSRLPKRGDFRKLGDFSLDASGNLGRFWLAHACGSLRCRSFLRQRRRLRCLERHLGRVLPRRDGQLLPPASTSNQPGALLLANAKLQPRGSSHGSNSWRTSAEYGRAKLEISSSLN